MRGGIVSNRKPFALVALFLIIALVVVSLISVTIPVDVLDNDDDEFFLFELPPIKEMQNKAAIERSQFIMSGVVVND